MWARYDGSPPLELIAPGAFDAWFETEDNDYDAVLDALEAHDAHSDHFPATVREPPPSLFGFLDC